MPLNKKTWEDQNKWAMIAFVWKHKQNAKGYRVVVWYPQLWSEEVVWLGFLQLSSEYDGVYSFHIMGDSSWELMDSFLSHLYV